MGSGKDSVGTPDLPAPAHCAGRALRVRHLEATDRALIEDFLRRIEPPDLRMRFFAGVHAVSPSLLDRLLRVAQAERVAIVAASAATAEEILGVARAELDTEVTGEIALLVRSDLKGRGLGSMLLANLIGQCRRRGIRRLIGDVLPHNARMLRLAEKFRFQRQRLEHGTVRLVLELGSPANSTPATPPPSAGRGRAPGPS